MKRSVLTSTLFALFASVALTTAPALAQGKGPAAKVYTCLLYTSDAADE